MTFDLWIKNKMGSLHICEKKINDISCKLFSLIWLQKKSLEYYREYEIECNIYVEEYTISKGENTI